MVSLQLYELFLERHRSAHDARGNVPELLTPLIDAVRVAIYAAVVETGRAPAPHDIALAYGFDEDEVAEAYRALADGHVIVLEQGTTTVRWAPPFSVVPTSFQSHADGSRWYAPCAWDAFGIPAALHRDANVEARCAWSGEPVVCGVGNGRAYGTGIVHLLVPAAHFWDDIGYT
jgi:hypothetical protein